MTEIKDLQAALKLFISAASKQGEATEVGDFRTCNKCYKDIERVASWLRENNQLSSLRDLLRHASVGVRIWAAGYLLPIHEEDAVRALNDISKMPGIHSLTATTTLSEWRKGNLKF